MPRFLIRRTRRSRAVGAARRRVLWPPLRRLNELERGRARPRSRSARRPDACRHRSRSAVPATRWRPASKELGWINGREHPADLAQPRAGRRPSEQAKEFVRQRVDVIVAFEDHVDPRRPSGDRGTRRTASPIVFLHPSDPVRDGLVKSLSHPGRKPDGRLRRPRRRRQAAGALRAARAAAAPRAHARRPDDPATERLLPQYRAAAAQLPRPLELVIRKASTAQDLKRVFRSLRPGEVDGAFLLSPNLRLNFSALTIRLAARAELPVQAHRKDWVEKGALFSYGADLCPIGRAGARYVDSILEGHAACRPGRRGRSRRRVRDQPQDRQQARHQGCRRR